MIINKPEKYEEIQVNEEFERIELGGHKAVIKKIGEYKSKESGKVSLKVEVDTTKDDKQPDYFQKQYDEDKKDDKKWPTGGTKYVSLKQDEKCIKMLKGFITAVENSNPGFTYNWEKDVDQLLNKKVGIVIGLEEYTNDKGETKTVSKIANFRSLDKVTEAKIPRVQLLDGTYIDYEEYKAVKDSKKQNSDPFAEFGETIEITDDFLD